MATNMTMEDELRKDIEEKEQKIQEVNELLDAQEDAINFLIMGGDI